MITTRRSFIAMTAAAAAGAPSLGAGTPVLLGGPIFLESDDPAALAREHRRLGYSAAYCPKIASLKNPDLIRAIQKAYASENVCIAEVGAWKNMLDPDAEKRRQNLEYVVERCALAEAVGARCCVDIAGSYNPDSYLELIHAVDRKAFGVHLDICNGINSPRRFYENTAYINECFSKLGPWIVCHAKDLKWIVELNVHFLEVIPGRGQIDYKTYLQDLSKLKLQTPLMLEHLATAAQYDEGREYIRRVGNLAGVTFA
jgi:sugar phosphate isomerase/epimerase